MIGGSPVPQYAYPQGYVPAPQYAQPYAQPQYAQPYPKQQSMPPVAWPQTAQQPTQGKAPTIRLVRGDDPKPVLKLPAWKEPGNLTLPPPESLGVAAAAVAGPGQGQPASVDWNLVRARLQRLNADGIQLIKLNDGSHRFSFLMPIAVDRARHFEVIAATEAEAVTLALIRAEESISQRP